jgi:DNA-binding LacI/PurR family transcriptional regulator
MYGLVRSLRAIEQAAKRARWELAVSAADRPRTVWADALSEWSSLDLRAVVVLGRKLPPSLDRLSTDLPVVLAGGNETASVPFVAVDQVAGARRATEHLLSQGSCTVWHIGGPEGWPESRDRERGWREALERAGAWQPPVIRGDWTPRSGYEAGELLLNEHGIDAIFVANDRMALGLCRAFAEGGRPVPDDIRVVGFDDTSEAAYLTPSLTTMRHDFPELGRQVIELVTAGGTGDGRVITPELIVRGSTGAGLLQT